MTKYMAEGLAGVGRLIEKRMAERGIPEKFFSANLYRRVSDDFEWKNGDTISEEKLDQIYIEIWGDEPQYKDRKKEAQLFDAISKYRNHFLEV